MTNLSAIIEVLRKGLINIYGDRLKGLRLFGSYARNEAVQGSDIDIALVLDNFDDPCAEIERTGELVSNICLENNVVISMLPVREREWLARQSPLMINIRREGITV